MINKTKYLQLKKPDGDEFYDIDVFNENADSIDGELKKNNEELAKKLSKDGNSDSNIVAFQTASKRENILSGETHKVIFGKIKKFFTDLKTVAFTGSYNDLTDLPSYVKSQTITSAVDWNTLTENGVYHIKTTEGTNRPVTNWGMLYVEGETSTKFQIFIPDVKNNVIYKRYENAGWKDWQELTLIETSGEVYDTGWKPVECGNGISAWSSSDAPRIRRVGKTVELVGIITNSTSFADHDSLFRNIPEDMWPSRNVWSIQQGDIKNKTTARWMMTINPGGKVSFNYYGFSGPLKISIGLCIPVHAVWMVD
jgi:hypothetical protein